MLTEQVEKKVTDSAPKPSESEIEDYYEAAKSTQYVKEASRNVRVILNKDKAKVEAAKKELEKDGKLYLTLGPTQREPVEPQALVAKVSAFLRQNPQLQALVAGDTRADYGRVYNAMVLLQQGGVAKVGLMSQPEHPEGAR